jgi:hypothetical protein
LHTNRARSDIDERHTGLDEAAAEAFAAAPFDA